MKSLLKRLYKEKTTAGKTHYQVISEILESNYGKRVSITQLAYPFRNERRLQMVNYNARIDEYRKRNPETIVTNKVKYINGSKHSWYMLHKKEDGLDQQPLPVNK